MILGLIGGGCRVTGLAYRDNQRVKIVEPTQNATVHLPMRLEWTASRPSQGTRYAIFTDQPPMGPDESLRSIADQTCKQTPGCPNKEYLEENNIYVTKAHSLVISHIPQLSAPLKNVHEITIVLLNSAGRRVGESFYSVNFSVASTNQS